MRAGAPARSAIRITRRSSSFTNDAVTLPLEPVDLLADRRRGLPLGREHGE
ncbi:hypothetical protein [Nonomuraea coxensis]|uniref:hypothetical protein n=1 Tax=Nonomuraea coxensis TaxID=404386 RepID=UPI00036F2149|nr:hypothetical protein [Nonomuraea coxensis]